MTQGAAVPILGYRRDRVGARLIGLLNILRFRALFGDDAARYAWLSQPDGPYPDLTDPAEVLSPRLIAEAVEVVSAPPELSARAQIRSIAARETVAQVRDRLAAGELWACDAAFDIIRFRDETPEAVAAQMRALTGALALSGALDRARRAALARLHEGRGNGAHPGAGLAIHLRRGDILDGDPWSWQDWPSKYAPDEYYGAFLSGATGPVLAFTDTPAAVAHLADPRILPVAGLMADVAAACGPLTVVQRDVLEILLMASCRRVGAPAYSAFSQAAAALGGVEVVALPGGLPPKARARADAALLHRVLRRHGSFLAPGDLAQSLIHVIPHAEAAGRGAELVDRFARRTGFLTRFPFVASALANLAARNGQPEAAAALAASVTGNPRATARDRVLGAQVKALIAAEDGTAARPGADGWAYVTDLFVGRRAEGPVMPRLGLLLLGGEGPLGRALGVPPALAHLLAGAFPDAQGLPPWAVQQGWVELIQMDEMLRRMRVRQSLFERLAPAAGALGAVEPLLASGRAPDAPDPADTGLLGWAATALTLDNRLARAMRLLDWLAAADPGCAVTAKRMADACFAAGNARAAWRWMDRAAEADPDSPLIQLSAAARLSGLGHLPAAHAANPAPGSPEARRQGRHLRNAARIAPDLALTESLRRRLRALDAADQPSGESSAANG